MEKRKLIVRLGQHTINIIFPRSKINFRFFLRTLRSNAIKEYNILNKLKDKINVPKVYNIHILENSTLVVREFISGTYFSKFIKNADPNQIKYMLRSLIKNLYLLEQEGIYIPEFSKLSKNVIVTSDGEPYIIDVERGRASRIPVITKLLSLIKNLMRDPKISKKLYEILKVDNIETIAKIYKKTRNLDLIYSLFLDNNGRS